MHRILATVVALLGVAGLALGVLGQTAWAPPEQYVATATVDQPGKALVIDPGVAYVGGQEGTVTVSGAPAGAPLQRIYAPEADLTAWLGENTRYTRVTGLDGWDTLTTETVNPDATGNLPDPAAADILRGTEQLGEDATIDIAELAASEVDSGSPYSSLAFVTDGTQDAPNEVTITWPNPQTNQWVPWAYGAGAVLLLAGIVLFVLGSRRRAAASRDDDHGDDDHGDDDHADDDHADDDHGDGAGATARTASTEEN